MLPRVNPALANDRHRPRYHFLPPAGWMNDPNGLIQWEGTYHLFYQYDPDFSGIKLWGHAVSQDLVHWEHWPVALSPTPGGPDKDGCWSGCAVNSDGVPTLVYTGVSPQVQCLATSRDGLRTWEKSPANPVLVAPPARYHRADFRDPYVWQEAGAWWMVVGTGTEPETTGSPARGAVLLFRGADLQTWEFVAPLLEGTSDDIGTVWECPNFFPLGERWVLLTTLLPIGRTIYYSGHYAPGDSLVPERRGEVDLGGHLYAPQAFADQTNRRLMFGWLWEGRSQAAERAADWAGVMSLPRVLKIDASGSLVQSVAPEVELLRGRHWQIVEGEPLPQSAQLEVVAQLEFPQGAGRWALSLARTPDGAEETRVEIDAATGTLLIDRDHSSQDPSVIHQGSFTTPIALAPDGTLQVRIFLDHSVLEVFAGGAAMASRIYPTRADAIGLAMETGGGARVGALDIWEMRSIWPEGQA